MKKCTVPTYLHIVCFTPYDSSHIFWHAIKFHPIIMPVKFLVRVFHIGERFWAWCKTTKNQSFKQEPGMYPLCYQTSLGSGHSSININNRMPASWLMSSR